MQTSDGQMGEKLQVARIVSGCDLEILRLMADGKNTKEIGYMLGMSVAEVLAHRACLMRKFAIHDAASLVRYAVWNGLLIP